MLELFNIVGIIIKCPSAGGHFVIIKGSIMLHSGKVCTTDGERTVPDCGLKPQLKECVEDDYYIYTWNSACTMEGIDITMVRNTLLNDTSGGLNCAGRFYLQNGEDTWEFTAAAICRRFHGREQTGTGTTAAAWRLAGGRIVAL